MRADVIRRNGVLSTADVLANIRHSFIDAARNVISAICYHSERGHGGNLFHLIVLNSFLILSIYLSLSSKDHFKS